MRSEYVQTLLNNIVTNLSAFFDHHLAVFSGYERQVDSYVAPNISKIVLIYAHLM